MRAGMTTHQSTKGHPFNMRNSIILFILGIYIASTAMYLIREAKTLKEYTDSIYFTFTSIASALNFIIVTWKMAEIFQFYDDLEEIVSTSKCDLIKMNVDAFCVNLHDVFYRTCGSNIEHHLHKNWWRNFKSCKKVWFCHVFCHTSIHHNNADYCQFCRLFYYRFGTGHFSVTISYCVSASASDIYFICAPIGNPSSNEYCA